MKNQQALIFIPDISGFTEFVKQVEIDHSQHIIKELLEIIIDENITKLEISEIEGDAILFYRMGPAPLFKEVVHQCKQMFLAFHQHLKLYKENLICQCGACSSHQSLSLKFVVHFGEVKEIAIKDFNKLHGEEIILAHRLLKNSITNSEYILFSEKFINSGSTDHDLMNGHSEYDEFGRVEYQYLVMNEWRHEVPDPVINKSPVPHYKNPIELDIIIDAPLDIVYQKFIDNSLKTEWVPGIKEIDMTNQPIPKKGSAHMCIFPGFAIDIELVDGKIQDRESIIIEHSKGVPLVKESYAIFKMKPEEKSTRLSLEVRIPEENLFQKLKKKIVFNKFKKSFNESLLAFKDYVEKDIEVL